MTQARWEGDSEIAYSRASRHLKPAAAIAAGTRLHWEEKPDTSSPSSGIQAGGDPRKECKHFQANVMYSTGVCAQGRA